MSDGSPSTPKISVVTTTRNAARHITRCLESVAAQTYSAVEHVIIDGASTDDTLAIVRSKVRSGGQLVSEPDQGIYDAMNRGVRSATGDYILILGGDDYLVDARVLEDVARFLAQNGSPDMIYGDLEVRDPKNGVSVFRPPEPDKALDLMICGCLPHQATLARKDMFTSKVGFFDERYRVQSDYDWFLRALGADNVTILHMPRVISSFALGGASSGLEIGQKETYAIQNSFPLYRRPEWMEKRLHEFQRQLLALRIQQQQQDASGAAPPPSLKRVARRVLDRLHLVKR